MNTTVYFIRHSQPLKIKSLNYNEHIQLQNEKTNLSKKSKKKTKIIKEKKEFKKI